VVMLVALFELQRACGSGSYLDCWLVVVDVVVVKVEIREERNWCVESY
jgi:hypothetical protein